MRNFLRSQSPHVPPHLRAFRLTWDDVHANRSGRLSDRQRARIKRARNGQIMVVVGVLCLLPLFIAPWLERFIGVMIGALSPSSLSFVGLSMAQGIPMIGLWLASRTLHRFNLDLLEGRVTHQRDRVRVAHIKGNGRTLHIGSTRFYIPRRVYDLCDAHTVYCVYATPHSGVLVAIEPAPESDGD